MTGHAQKKAGDLQDQAADTVEGARATATDALNKGQAHGESAWQKAKDVVNHAYEQVGGCLSRQTVNQSAFSPHHCLACFGPLSHAVQVP